MIRLPFLVHRVRLRSGSWIAQESVGSHHSAVCPPNITVALLRCSVASSWIRPVVVVIR